MKKIFLLGILWWFSLSWMGFSFDYFEKETPKIDSLKYLLTIQIIGLLLYLFAMILVVYWEEARHHYSLASKASKEKECLDYAKNFKRAFTVFRVSSGLFTSLVIFLIQQLIAIKMNPIVVASLALFAFLGIFFATGKSFVKYEMDEKKLCSKRKRKK